jgi:hypothetical protein
VLVFEDMLGLTPRVPKFVRRYGAVGEAVADAVRGYAEDVRARRFPGPPMRPMGSRTTEASALSKGMVRKGFCRRQKSPGARPGFMYLMRRWLIPITDA